MERRRFLRRTLGGAAGLALWPGIAAAGQGHGCFRPRPGEVRCQVGFPDAPFIEPQPCRSLCWANCLAYVLAGYGARMSVASVLYRMGAPERCSARDDAAILMGAAGQWVDDVGRSFLVRVNRLPDLQAASATAEQFEPIVHALSRRPLIVGVPGHSRVLVDMVYVDAPMIWMRQDALTFRDPWTGSPNRVVEAWDAGPERLFALGFEVRKV